MHLPRLKTVVVFVVVENNIIYINIIVGARVARMGYFLLVFTTHFATHVLETIVLACNPHARELLL